ncbi:MULTISPECIES: flippase [Spirosoma]|uniref:Flippase n=1 Tax=Spirosoma liriopis TaxID=2937440 RepID=A0ABT0HGD7_9BACT|nr:MULTISPECIES: flippase [Spirosoma]MCK8490957.1 flippase [Spirosoma liriopis]UHG90341.1 flippase [Spirosoma oryzicola]
MLSKEVSDNDSTDVNAAVATPVAEKQPVLSRPILKRFAINVASLFSVQVANMLLPLLTVPYVVRIIGPERLGLLNFSQAYVAYFTLLINYGFETASLRSIAANRSDKAHVNRIFSEVIAGKAVLWVLSTLIFGTLSYFVAEFREHLVLHICTYLMCIGTVLFPVWLYQAMEDLGRVAIFNLVVKVIFSLSVFLLIRKPEDYIYQNLSISIAQIVVSVIAFKVALSRFNLTFTWPTLQQFVNRFREDSTLFFSSVMITLYAGSTVFLLGLLSNPYDVGIFSAGTRLETLSRSFVSMALNQAFFPIVASAFGTGREEGLRIVRTTFFPLALLMILMSAGLWIVAPWFIDLLYGSKFHDAILVLRIVSLLPIMIGISNLLGLHTMLNLRMDKAFFRITAIGSVVGLALNTMLIDRMGYVGAAYAWVAAEAYITLSMYIYLRNKGVEVINLSYLKEAVTFSKTRLTTLFK